VTAVTWRRQRESEEREKREREEREKIERRISRGRTGGVQRGLRRRGEVGGAATGRDNITRGTTSTAA